jgi:hypothetical protein
MQHFKSTREVADWLGVEEWRVRRIFEARLVPEPPRIGRHRAIPTELIPNVIDALRTKGWLRERAAAEAPEVVPCQ